MDGSTTTHFWLYDRHVDTTSGRVTHGRESSQLNSHQLQVLLLLTRHPELTLSQHAIEKAIWGDAPAGDAIYRCISHLRAALGDPARQSRFIQTVPCQGYRLIAPVQYAAPTPGADQLTRAESASRTPSPAAQLDSVASHPPRPGIERWRAFAMHCGGAVLLLALGMCWLVIESNHAARESAQATQITQFMENVFASSDPQVMPGRSDTAQDLLSRALQRIDTDLKQQPQVRMQMLEIIGRSYAHHHLGGQAVPALEEALRIRRGSSSEPQPEVALTLVALGGALRGVNRFDEARHAYREALDILDTTQVQPSRDFATTAGQLGNLEVEQGHFAQGMQILDASLQQLRSIQGSYHSDTARILVGISHACQCTGDMNRAEQALHEAQRIYRVSTPELNPHRLAADHAAGQSLLLRQRFDEAALILERTLAGRHQLFGPSGIPVAETLDLLGRVRNGQGRLREAEQLKMDALLALEGLGEAANLQRANIQLSLATLLMRTSQFSRSESLLREALDLYSRALPADHISRISAEHYLGETLLARRKYREAEAILSAALQRMQRASVPQWRVARSMSALGEVLYRQGKTEAAQHLLLDSYARLADDPDAKQVARAQAQQRITTLLGKPTKWASVASRR
jgi:DNA-binding winged helix-turn-helix (wHTH) protein/tetratricopeptide (TPR) repeat protein